MSTVGQWWTLTEHKQVTFVVLYAGAKDQCLTHGQQMSVSAQLPVAVLAQSPCFQSAVSDGARPRRSAAEQDTQH